MSGVLDSLRSLSNRSGKLDESLKRFLRGIKPEIWLILILIFALSLRLYFFVGPNINDDVDYVFSAHEVSEGRFYPLYGKSINAIRSMMTAPVALFFKIFGVGIYSASIYPIVCSLITIVSVFYIGKILVDYKVGLVSAAILSFYPVDIVFSTQLVPTTPVTAFVTLGLLLFLYGEKMEKKLTLFVLSGVMIGLSYLANIMTFFIVASIAFSYLAINRKIRKEYLLIALGFLLVFSGETLFMYANTGNPWHRLDVFHETERMIGTNTDMNYYQRVMLKVEGVNFNAQEGNLGIFVYLFIVASLFALGYEPEKKLWFLIVSFFLIMSYFQFGVMTAGFKPIAKWVRYLIVLGPVFSLLIGYMFEKVTKKAYLKIILVALFFSLTLPFIIGSAQAYRSWTEEFTVEYDYLKGLPEKTVYTDQGSLGFLQFYFGYEWDIKILEKSKLEDIKDSYVILDGSRGVVQNAVMRENLPDFAKNPPKEWKLLAVLESWAVSPKIYYAP